MALREALLLALRGVSAHRLRSVLTMLGLIIGVSAVIVLFACGQGVQNSVDVRIAPVANSITIVPHPPNILGGSPAQNLTDADAAALESAPDVATVTPAVTGTAPIEINTTTFLSASIIGSTEYWARTNNRDLTAGSFFGAAEARESARVAVLGPTVANTLFGDRGAAMDQTIRISHVPFRVVGVMQSYGQQLDNTVVVPLNTARRYVVGPGIGTTAKNLNQITVQAHHQTAVPAAMGQVTRILDARHHIANPRLRDFQVQSIGRRLTTFNQILRLLTLVTPAVAGLALVVGGIGVLNIMLVSVTERTREIGIRKAVGATSSAILKQFLIESTVLAGLGGLVGVGAGIGLTLLVRVIAPAFDPRSGALSGFTPVLSVFPVLLAFAVSLAIGLIAGSYPAYRAARLRPIDALRYE
jgi:putative ABC transport system permease protein